jgi:hypothetical protein
LKANHGLHAVVGVSAEHSHDDYDDDDIDDYDEGDSDEDDADEDSISSMTDDDDDDHDMIDADDAFDGDDEDDLDGSYVSDDDDDYDDDDDDDYYGGGGGDADAADLRGRVMLRTCVDGDRRVPRTNSDGRGRQLCSVSEVRTTPLGLSSPIPVLLNFGTTTDPT